MTKFKIILIVLVGTLIWNGSGAQARRNPLYPKLQIGFLENNKR